MKIGLPRHSTTICWPGAIGVRSTSFGAPAAITSAEGSIESISAQPIAAPPIAAPAPAIRARKSRRVLSGCPDAACDDMDHT
jgi:hypothetical protein